MCIKHDIFFRNFLTQIYGVDYEQLMTLSRKNAGLLRRFAVIWSPAKTTTYDWSENQKIK